MTIDQILSRLVAGALTTDAAACELEQLARTNRQQRAALIARIQSDVAAGRLSHADARALLGAIERALHDPAAEQTSVPDATLVDEDVTSTRPGSPDATERYPQDATQQPTVRPIARTLVRPAPTDSDETTMRATTVDATQPVAPATLRMPPRVDDTLQPDVPQDGTAAHDPDATLQTARQFPPTAARTVQMELSTQAMNAPAATLQSPDKTQVIAERLVKSLDDVDEPRGALQPGSIIKKRFVLETLLGKGGMGLVFGAIDRRKEEAQDPNPRVALKVLNADFERHPQSFIALQREARKAQTLAHPNVVTVFDFDRDGETVYMTMEL
ncbi:MAG TPA: hypothetical protein VKB34_01950, partial [Povalibacter sp.]|nr:hypothetical protein [Povalibacter sp.]